MIQVDDSDRKFSVQSSDELIYQSTIHGFAMRHQTKNMNLEKFIILAGLINSDVLIIDRCRCRTGLHQTGFRFDISVCSHPLSINSKSGSVAITQLCKRSKIWASIICSGISGQNCMSDHLVDILRIIPYHYRDMHPRACLAYHDIPIYIISEMTHDNKCPTK